MYVIAAEESVPTLTLKGGVAGADLYVDNSKPLQNIDIPRETLDELTDSVPSVFGKSSVCHRRYE
jgi:hypothetical protein